MHQALCQAYEGSSQVRVRHAERLNVLLEFGLFCRATLESFIEEKISMSTLKNCLTCGIDSNVVCCIQSLYCSHFFSG